MLPETLVTLICTLDQSGSCCCATAAGPQTRAAPASERTIQVRALTLISLLLRKAWGFYHCEPRQMRRGSVAITKQRGKDVKKREASRPTAPDGIALANSAPVARD